MLVVVLVGREGKGRGKVGFTAEVERGIGGSDGRGRGWMGRQGWQRKKQYHSNLPPLQFAVLYSIYSTPTRRRGMPRSVAGAEPTLLSSSISSTQYCVVHASIHNPLQSSTTAVTFAYTYIHTELHCLSLSHAVTRTAETDKRFSKPPPTPFLHTAQPTTHPFPKEV